MKRFFTFLTIAFLTGNLYANPGDTITLDLSKSLNPETFTFTPEGYWTETYNETDYTFFDFKHFSFCTLLTEKDPPGVELHGTVSLSV